MATYLIYNGIQLKNVLTRSFSQEAVYDESGTDLLYHRFIVKVLGYCHGTTAADTVNTVPNLATAVGTQRGVRFGLMEPRCAFQFRVGLDVLLAATPTSERNNGPKPRKCEVTHISGTKMLRVEYEIEVCILECVGDYNTSAVLNNRWSMIDDVDGDFYTTRTIRGRLRVARNDFNPQGFRGWVVPPLQRGFRRESMHFETTPDGLMLEYQIVDRQQWAAPPFPATSWEGTHTVSSAEGGTTVFSEISLRMTGPPSADKESLILACIQVAVEKLELLAGVAAAKASGGKNGYLLLNSSITDYMHVGTIELRARIQHFADDVAAFIGTKMRTIGKPLSLISVPTSGGPTYDRHLHPSPPLYAEAPLVGLFVSYLQSPCNPFHQVQATTFIPDAIPRDDRSDAPLIYTSPGTAVHSADPPVLVQRNLEESTRRVSE